MKIKTSIAAALFIFSAVVNGIANDPKGVTGMAVVPVKGTQVYKVIFKGEAYTRVKLNVYNAKADLIFSETLNSKGFIRPLNFSGLQDGEYTVEMIGGNGKKVEKISIAKEKSPTSYVHVSRLVNENGKYLVSVVNSQKAADKITVRIFNGKDLIHNESKSVDGDFAQVYAVKVAGDVTFEVVGQDGVVKVARF